MQGFRFLVLGEKGPTAHGIITQQITPEKYLCTFLMNPQVSRVCSIDEIQQWNLFPNEDAMNAFAVHLRRQTQPPPAPQAEPPAEPPAGTPPEKKKKVHKKKASVKK